MALAAMATYLAMSGFPWNCDEVEKAAILLRSSAKETKEEGWEAW
jgi:hypothetical protein